MQIVELKVLITLKLSFDFCVRENCMAWLYSCHKLGTGCTKWLMQNWPELTTMVSFVSALGPTSLNGELKYTTCYVLIHKKY